MAKKSEPEDAGIEVYDVKKNVEKGAKWTKAFVKKHPWESVGIAVLGGALIARLLYGKRK